MQDLFSVSEADYGHLLDDMVVLNGQPVAVDKLLQPGARAKSPSCSGEI